MNVEKNLIELIQKNYDIIMFNSQDAYPKEVKPRIVLTQDMKIRIIKHHGIDMNGKVIKIFETKYMV